MIRISITPYFSSVTCGENKDTLKSRSWVWPRYVCSFISAVLLTWSLRSRSTNPGMLLANSVTSLTASTERDWQLLKKRSSSSSEMLLSDPLWAPVRPVFGWDVWSEFQGWKLWTYFHKDLKAVEQRQTRYVDAWLKEKIFWNLWPKVSYKTAQHLMWEHELITNWSYASNRPITHHRYVRCFYLYNS